MLEQILLQVHAHSDQVPALLQHQRAAGEMDPHVRPIDLFLNNQRLIGEELNRLPLAKMFIVRSPSRAKQMRRPRILHKVTREEPMMILSGF